MNRIFLKIFKQGSKTYFYSSLFFPKKIREDVFTLYSFVRTVDNYVDQIPQDAKSFYELRELFEKAGGNLKTGNFIIDSFRDLMARKELPKEWVDAFLDSMQMDLTKRRYEKIDETLSYIYGSAEVIGLMMSKVLGLNPESYECAKMQGRAMQYINFIRDIQEDNDFGRTYLPLEGSQLKSLNQGEAEALQEQFQTFILKQVFLYERWQNEAEKGYRYIPRRYLIPVKTASDMYRWTARKIAKNPLIVFQKKIKPSVLRILWMILKNTIDLRKHQAY